MVQTSKSHGYSKMETATIYNGTNFHKNHLNGHSNGFITVEHNKKPMNMDISTPSDGFYKDLVSQLNRLSLELVEERSKNTGTCHPQCRILEEKQGWKYVGDLHKCAGIHLKHFSDYHQFYVECLEYNNWMKDDVMRSGEYLADVQTAFSKLDEQELNNFMEKTKELGRILSYWRLKLMELKNKAEVLVPIHLRDQSIDQPLQSRCIVDYEDAQGVLREDEDVVLVDKKNESKWKVRSQHGNELSVPSIFLMILGPVPEALAEVQRVIDTYGELWTVLRGLARKALINLICGLVDACDGFDERSWLSMSRDKLQKIEAIMKLMEDMFGMTWCCHQPGMREKVDQLRNFIDKSFTTGKVYPENRELLRKMLVKNPDLIQEFLKLFQESWSDRNRFWTPKTNNVCRAIEKFEDDQEFEAVYAIEEVYKLTRAKETTEASHLTTSQQEEKRTFVITGVVDPKNNQIISLDQAIKQGIINQKEGKYIGSRKQMPIAEAMNQNLIKVENTKKQVSQEKKNDYGFITIKSYIETRPYTIRMVVDSETKANLTLDEAVKKGVINQKQNVYRNPRTRTEMSFEEALEKGLLVVDFTDEGVKEEDCKEPAVISYAVFSALDTRSGQWLNFKKAVDLGLLNPEEGTFVDKNGRHQFKFVEAIDKGLIKATKVADHRHIDLLPLTEQVFN